ncbi:MAG: hypothetical protein JWP87_3263 [Labilithrix sp.]|nr:hypothetical protein [Labilithrix sp.]
MRPAAERPLNPTWLRLSAITALGLLLTTYAWWPMFLAYPKTPEEDGRHFFFQFETVKAAIRTYHELPLWNPFDCHGIPLWNHPESMAGGPILLLTTGLSTTITVMLWNIIHVTAGFVGMWLLVRDDLKLTRMAALIAASMFAFGVAHTDQYAGEHSTLAGFLYAPLLLLLWRKAEQSWNARVGAGLVVALMVFEGQTYPLPYTLLVLGLETLTRVWRPARMKNIVVAGLTVGFVGVMVSACRLLPLVDELAAHKRPMEPDFDHLWHIRSIIDMYVLRTPHWRSRFVDQQYVFGEYLTYIGWMGVILVLIGMAASAAEYTWLLVLTGLTFLFMLGHFAPWAPYSFLQNNVLPFKSMRVPSRYRLLMIAHLSMFVALAVDKAPKLWRESFGMPRFASAMRAAFIGMALIAIGDAIGLGQEIQTYRFNGAPEAKVVRATRFHYANTGLTPDFIDQPRQNKAWLGCRHYTWAFGSDAPVWTGDVPQAKAVDDGATVEVANRTHNTFTVDVDVKRPARILLNSAWDRGWTSDVGALVQNDDKLIAIDLPPGRYQVHARYWPRYLTLGLWMSAIGILGVALFFARRPLKARARFSFLESGSRL